MSASAAVMVALLIHFGGVGLDTSSHAAVMQYRETLQTGYWDAQGSTRHDSWVLTRRSGETAARSLVVQRMQDAEQVYALAVAGADSSVADSVGIVSLGAAREHLTATAREGTGVIPSLSILVGWDERAAAGAATPGGTPPATTPPAPPAASPGFAPLEGEFHIRWSPGEIAVSHPHRSELFILRYR